MYISYAQEYYYYGTEKIPIIKNKNNVYLSTIDEESVKEKSRESNLIFSESNELPSGSNVEFIGHNSITLNPGFKAELGATFKADIQAASTKSATVISINEFDKLKKFIFTVNEESKLKSGKENNQTVETISNEAFNNISVYPNPVSEIINITDISGSGINKIEIYNSNGVFINCEIDNSSLPISINVSAIPKGLYFIQIQIDKDYFTKKIIKQ